MWTFKDHFKGHTHYEKGFTWAPKDGRLIHVDDQESFKGKIFYKEQYSLVVELKDSIDSLYNVYDSIVSFNLNPYNLKKGS